MVESVCGMCRACRATHSVPHVPCHALLSGLDTIRAFGRVPAFNAHFDVAISGFMNVSYWQACRPHAALPLALGARCH